MVSKDQTIGGLIFIICAVVGLLYVVTLFYPAWFSKVGLPQPEEADVRFWVIAVPVLVAFIAIMGIGAWIGWTMATTPPPKPIEEITSEIEKEERKTVETKPAEETEKEEVKKHERKRKSEE